MFKGPHYSIHGVHLVKSKNLRLLANKDATLSVDACFADMMSAQSKQYDNLKYETI